jgi:long-subunit acyl-CoA synthetase (AMP-forming)
MVVANNSPNWVQLFLGPQLIGAVLVPVDASSTPATTLKLIDQTDPKLLFRSRHLRAELETSPIVGLLDDLSEQCAAYSATAPDVELTGDEGQG